MRVHYQTEIHLSMEYDVPDDKNLKTPIEWASGICKHLEKECTDTGGKCEYFIFSAESEAIYEKQNP